MRRNKNAAPVVGHRNGGGSNLYANIVPLTEQGINGQF